MTKSAKGTLENPGVNVSAKRALNNSIISQGFGEFIRMLEYKCLWNGKTLVKVNPRNTSRTCSSCCHVSKENRKTQEKFKCVSCGFETNADYNASLNILNIFEEQLSLTVLKILFEFSQLLLRVGQPLNNFFKELLMPVSLEISEKSLGCRRNNLSSISKYWKYFDKVPLKQEDSSNNLNIRRISST
jgi:hypothetical protein